MLLFLSAFLPLSSPESGGTGINSYFDVIMKGGVIMIPILLLSMVSIYVFVEKIIYINRSTRNMSGFAYKLLHIVREDGKDEAYNYCRNTDTSFGRIFGNGILRLDKSAKEAESIMESTADVEIAHMERNLGYLGVIAGIAPMLGFVGTIIGVIKIFYGIAIADNISIGIIAGGLYQKMVASGTGLIVGVVAYSFYHYLHIKVDKFVATLQEESLEFFKSL
jgi:biopolymer transport protein ExbB